MTQPLEILVLDDERDAADMMCEVLGLYFPQAMIRVAYRGEDALKLGSERRPATAIFDLEMAGMGGESAARALRSTWADLPLVLIALSGNVQRLNALRKEGPFNHLLSKPVDMDTLVKLLNKRA